MNKGIMTRDLFGPGQSGAIPSLLQSLFLAELLRPSEELWLAFGWISDIKILDNRARQFSAIKPDWPAADIPLTSVIKELIIRGGRVSLVLREDDHNQNFINKLNSVCADVLLTPEQLRVYTDPGMHWKGIVSDEFLLKGSMNLTYNGITVNGEHLTLTTDRALCAQWRQELEQKWGGIGK